MYGMSGSALFAISVSRNGNPCRSFLVALVVLICLQLPNVAIQAADPSPLEKYLFAAQLADGEQDFAKQLAERPDDDHCRFSLGVLRFLRAIEQLGKSLHHFGAIGSSSPLARQLPLVRLAVPDNPKPAKVNYDDFRGIVQRLLHDLKQAEETLAPIDQADIKLPLHFGLVALDFNGDARADDQEKLWRIYGTLNGGLQLGPQFTPDHVQSFVIAFDHGDVYWLRGYCHLLSAIGETLLAYDQQQAFDMLARQLFKNPSAQAIPAPLLPPDGRLWGGDALADFIAAVHLSKFQLKEPQRMQAALDHLREVIRLSRKSWQAIQAETDNDNEWVPNSKQTGVIPNVRVTEPMIRSWHELLDEADQLLQGKKLIPHFRLNELVGINLRRVFEEPRDFDLVLWAHGIAALPYIEPGPTSRPETWNRLQQVFQGQFIGFAFWFN